MITENCLVGCTPKAHHKNCNHFYYPFNLDAKKYEKIENEIYLKLQPEAQEERVINIEKLINDFDLKTISKYKEYYEKYFLTNFAVKELGITVSKVSELLGVHTARIKQYIYAHTAVSDCHWYHIKTSKIEGVLKTIKLDK